MPVTGLSRTTTAMPCGLLCDLLKAGSACHVPQYVGLVARSNADANVTSTWLTPRSQCAAVRKIVGAISVPVHSSQVPSENGCCASRAPTSGWRFPSGPPLMIARAPPTAKSVAKVAAAAAKMCLFNFPPLGFSRQSRRPIPERLPLLEPVRLEACAEVDVDLTERLAAVVDEAVRRLGRDDDHPARADDPLALPVRERAFAGEDEEQLCVRMLVEARAPPRLGVDEDHARGDAAEVSSDELPREVRRRQLALLEELDAHASMMAETAVSLRRLAAVLTRPRISEIASQRNTSLLRLQFAYRIGTEARGGCSGLDRAGVSRLA